MMERHVTSQKRVESASIIIKLTFSIQYQETLQTKSLCLSETLKKWMDKQKLIYWGHRGVWITIKQDFEADIQHVVKKGQHCEYRLFVKMYFV